MKLFELLDVIDPNRDYDEEIIQIVYGNNCWDDFEEAPSSSTLLVPLYNAEVTSLSAVDINKYRVGVDVPGDIVMFPLSEKELKQCIWEGIHEGLDLDINASVPSVKAQNIYASIRKRLEKEKHNERDTAS